MFDSLLPPFHTTVLILIVGDSCETVCIEGKKGLQEERVALGLTIAKLYCESHCQKNTDRETNRLDFSSLTSFQGRFCPAAASTTAPSCLVALVGRS